MRTLIFALAAAASLTLAGSSSAQRPGPNGGLIGGTGEHQVELVTSPTEITVYLLDDGKVESPKGSSVRAVVQDGSKNTTVALTPTDGNKLVGKLAAPLSKGARVVVSGKDSHGHIVQARFVIN